MLDFAIVYAHNLSRHLNSRKMDLCLSVKNYTNVKIDRKSVGEGWGFGKGIGKIKEPMELCHKMVKNEKCVLCTLFPFSLCKKINLSLNFTPQKLFEDSSYYIQHTGHSE